MAETPKITIEPPEYLNPSLLLKAMKQGLENESIQILYYDIKPAVGVGDNYASCIFRVKLTIQIENKAIDKSIIIKTLPQRDIMVNVIREWGFFRKEAKMLSSIVPKIQNILSKVGISTDLCAKIYLNDGPPNEAVVMEDLVVSGFKLGNRFEGLDLEHCVLVLENLACLHAGSLILLENEPKIKEEFSDGFWEAEGSTSKMYSSALTTTIEKLESWSFNEYSKKLQKISVDTMIEKIFKATKRDDSLLNVLNHGDLWTNNMMFKYSEDNKVTAVKFVDFQMSSYNSPALDIIYFMFISPRLDVKLKSLDFLIETYYNKFSSVCEALNIQPNYTLEDLKKDIQKRLAFAYGVTASIFPLTSAPPEDALKTNEIDEENTGFSSENNMFNNKKFKEGLIDVLKYLDDNNFFRE